MSAPGFPHLPAESWERFLRDELEGASRERVATHADECDACRAILVAADPSFAFRALRVPAPDGTWDGFWDELRPELARREAPRRVRPLLLAAAAAAVAGVAVLTVVLREAPGPDRAVQEDPCSASSVAGLRLSRALTRAECEALYGAPIEEPQPEVVVIHDLDLRGL